MALTTSGRNELASWSAEFLRLNDDYSSQQNGLFLELENGSNIIDCYLMIAYKSAQREKCNENLIETYSDVDTRLHLNGYQIQNTDRAVQDDIAISSRLHQYLGLYAKDSTDTSSMNNIDSFKSPSTNPQLIAIAIEGSSSQDHKVQCRDMVCEQSSTDSVSSSSTGDSSDVKSSTEPENELLEMKSTTQGSSEVLKKEPDEMTTEQSMKEWMAKCGCFNYELFPDLLHCKKESGETTSLSIGLEEEMAELSINDAEYNAFSAAVVHQCLQNVLDYGFGQMSWF